VIFCKHTLYMYLEGKQFYFLNTIFSPRVIGDNIFCSKLRVGRAGISTLGAKFYMLPK
jgi:hypothetical protein